MPESNRPLVERIARVLAGAAHSSNAEGSDPSAGEKVDLVWREHVNQALAVLHTMREPDEAHGRGGRRRDVAQDGRSRDRRARRLSPRDASGGERRAPIRAGRSSPASSPRACRSSTARCSTSRCRRSATAIGAGAQQVQWVVNAYLLPLSALLLLGGALGDHFGRRRLLVVGTSLFAVTSLVCALAPSLPLLLAARAAQGIGAALLLPNSLALLNAAFQGEKRGRAVGIWAAAGAAAAAIAPLIGGWLVGTVGWPAIFYINLPLALGAILLALRFVGESREPGAGRTDYAGALLATRGPRRPDLCADLVVGDAALHDARGDRVGRRRCCCSALPVGRISPRAAAR